MCWDDPHFGYPTLDSSHTHGGSLSILDQPLRGSDWAGLVDKDHPGKEGGSTTSSSSIDGMFSGVRSEDICTAVSCPFIRFYLLEICSSFSGSMLARRQWTRLNVRPYKPCSIGRCGTWRSVGFWYHLNTWGHNCSGMGGSSSFTLRHPLLRLCKDWRLE